MANDKSVLDKAVSIKTYSEPTLLDRVENGVGSGLKWGVGSAGLLLFAEWADKATAPLVKRIPGFEYKAPTLKAYEAARKVAFAVGAVAAIGGFILNKKSKETPAISTEFAKKILEARQIEIDSSFKDNKQSEVSR